MDEVCPHRSRPCKGEAQGRPKGQNVLRTGQILEGKYRIEKKIDEGGMGQVYRVEHLHLQRPFALKTLSQISLQAAEQQQFAQQFALEAKTLASLDHPGLTRVVDLFHDDKTSYLVMELVEGVTLTQMVEDSLNRLSQETVQRLAAQVLDVLEYLHGADPPIIVRDVKPDNLMITPEGRLKLIDFGLAKRLIAGQKTESIVRGMGSDCYSPMEQYGDGVTDQRSDLFSLAATLYFALTAKPPTPVWKRASTKEPLAHPGEHNTTVTQEFWQGLQALLEVEMDSRPLSVAEARGHLLIAPLPAGGKTAMLTVSHGTEYRLGSAEPYFPFQPNDWVLKVMQAATLARAREVRVTQNRSVCRINLSIPADILPDAGQILEALVGDSEHLPPWLRELALGLKLVGEFRDFRLLLDNWRRAWKVSGRGGTLEAEPAATQGKAGLSVEVDYAGKGADRARQAADEMVNLVRRTRLCPFPLFIDDRRLEPGRSIDRPLLAKEVREVYLASVSMPADGRIQRRAADHQEEGLSEEEAWTTFTPHDGRPAECHVDLRCYLAPGRTGFGFVKQPLRLLWYRHGVLCAEQEIVKQVKSLEVLVHLDGSYLPATASGLRLTPADLMFPGQLKPLSALPKVLPVVKAELERYRPPEPSNPVGRTAVGAVAAPLLVMLFGAVAVPVVLKSSLAAGAAALGGMAGYLNYDRQEESLRDACLKALSAYEVR